MNGFDSNGGFNVKMGKQAKVRMKVGADLWENVRAQDWKLNPSFAMQDLTPLGYEGKYEVPDQTTVELALTMLFRTDSKIHQRIISMFAPIVRRTTEDGEQTEQLISQANNALQLKARLFVDATHFYECEMTIKGVSQGVSVGNKMSFDVNASVRGLPKYVELETTVEATPGTASIGVAATQQLAANVVNPPSNYTLNWTSDTPAKATVDSTGLVTGITAGAAVITCEVLDWGVVVATDVVSITVS